MATTEYIEIRKKQKNRNTRVCNLLHVRLENLVHCFLAKACSSLCRGCSRRTANFCGVVRAPRLVVFGVENHPGSVASTRFHHGVRKESVARGAREMLADAVPASGLSKYSDFVGITPKRACVVLGPVECKPCVSARVGGRKCRAWNFDLLVMNSNTIK